VPQPIAKVDDKACSQEHSCEHSGWGHPTQADQRATEAAQSSPTPVPRKTQLFK
jgi:hypothetical protein